MPYIKQQDRARLEGISNEIGYTDIQTGGELNYLVTLLALRFLETHGKSYSTLSEIDSSLDCARLEFYRRVTAPYENEKIAQNGDVY